jgi:hypothetical protein
LNKTTKKSNVPTALSSKSERPLPIPHKMKTKHVRNLLAQQRERHIVLCKKRDALQCVMKTMNTSSKNAIKLLGDIQNSSEEFVSFGTAVISKVQHAVTVCDPLSLAVAGSITSIDVARSSVERADAGQCAVQTMATQMQGVCEEVLEHQCVMCEDLGVMHTSLMCAADAHSQALSAIEQQGVGQQPISGLQCAVCFGDAEAAYAARTGLCKKCHDTANDEMKTGWIRCVDAVDSDNAMQDADNSAKLVIHGNTPRDAVDSDNAMQDAVDADNVMQDADGSAETSNEP